MLLCFNLLSRLTSVFTFQLSVISFLGIKKWRGQDIIAKLTVKSRPQMGSLNTQPRAHWTKPPWWLLSVLDFSQSALQCLVFFSRYIDGCYCLVAVMSDSFVTPCAVAHQASLSMGFPRQESWSGLPFPSPGVLPHPGMEPTSPALQADSLPLSHWERPQNN